MIEAVQRCRHAVDSELGQQRIGAQQVIVCIEPGRPVAPEPADLGELQCRLDRRGDTLGNPVLQLEDILQIAIETVRPEMGARRGIDELAGDAKLVATAADAALQHVGHAELLPNLADIDRSALVGERGVAGDDEQPAAARQRRDDLLRHPVGKVVLLRIAAHVGERQHRNRRQPGTVAPCDDCRGGCRGRTIARRFRLRIGDLTHLTHEANALARQRPDQALLRAVVADCGARRIQAAAEGRLGDDATVPHGFQQVVTADDPIPRLDQKREHVEDLRLDRDQVVTLTQLPPGGIEGAACQTGRSRRDRYS